MSIRIITDSAADIPQNYDEKILVLPLHISFGEDRTLRRRESVRTPNSMKS